jgi:hypothetical protein
MDANGVDGTRERGLDVWRHRGFSSSCSELWARAVKGRARRWWSRRGEKGARGADVAGELWRPGQGATRAGVRVRRIPWPTRRAGSSGADGAVAGG